MEEANVTEAEAAAAKADAEAETGANEDSTSSNENEDTSNEDTSNEDNQNSSDETGEVDKELAEKNKKLFARAKKAEDELRALKLGNKGDKTDKGGNQFASANPLELAKTVAALKDFSSDELDYVQLIAGGKGLSLDDAVKTDEVKTYVEAKRAKVESENKTPSPSSPSLAWKMTFSRR